MCAASGEQWQGRGETRRRARSGGAGRRPVEWRSHGPQSQVVERQPSTQSARGRRDHEEVGRDQLLRMVGFRISSRVTSRSENWRTQTFAASAGVFLQRSGASESAPVQLENR